MQTEMLPNNPRQRGEILLQKYFDCEMTSEEESELLALLGNDQAFKQEARKSYQVESQFRFLSMLKRKPLRVELLHQSPLIFSLPEYGFLHEDDSATFQEPQRDVPSADPFSFDSLNMDELIHLATQSPSLPKPEAELKSKVAVKPRPTVFARKESGFPLLLKILTPLVLLVFGFMAYFEFKPVSEVTEPDDPFGPFPARIIELVDATFAEDVITLKKGQRLDAGPVSFLSGLMEIEYKNGVRIVLEGPAKYHVETLLESACDLGRLSAYVPPEGKGFTVTTPMMTVRDLGTKFVLDVDEANTKLQVVEGEVEANWLTKDWLSFKAGRGVQRQVGSEVRNFVADPETFVSEDSVRQRKADYVAVRRAVWTEQTRRWNSDPALVYRLEPEAISHLGKMPGSRDGKTVIRFRGPSDRLPLALHGECRDLTMIASVRLRNLTNFCNTLFVGDRLGTKRGEFLWQLNRSGELHFHVDEGGTSVRAFPSTSTVAQKDCNVWLQLAVVADGTRKTITHYVDGRPVAERAWPRPIPLRLDRATIGNANSDSKNKAVRFFNGDIEDFWIFSRPFDDRAVEEFYRNSN